MTDLDRYRPPDYDAPTGPWSRWAFLTVPQVALRKGQWVARAPGSTFTVTAPTREDAVLRLAVHMRDRKNRYAADEALFTRHLKKPVSGVYAMDIGVFNRLRETESDEDMRRAFEDAESYRRQGREYTVADYERTT